jgi:orotidine-5'-phosphate decarboxylase
MPPSPDSHPPAQRHPADRLAHAIARAGTAACVGLDPVLERLPPAIDTADAAGAIEDFCTGVIDAVADLVGVVKPQAACFERFGWQGVRALERTIARAKDRGLYVILDAKRGDIGTTSAHYAAAAQGMGADAITVNPYLGPSGLAPFLDAGLQIFALVRTSNPDSDRVQAASLTAGGTVAEAVARMLTELGRGRESGQGQSPVGAVVGATKAGRAEAAAIRTAMPNAWFLVPGIGAQGGDVNDLAAIRRPGTGGPDQAGLIVNASRSVIFPAWTEYVWENDVQRAAEALVRELSVV